MSKVQKSVFVKNPAAHFTLMISANQIFVTYALSYWITVFLISLKIFFAVKNITTMKKHMIFSLDVKDDHEDNSYFHSHSFENIDFIL